MHHNKDEHIFLLKNSFRRKGIVYRVIILNLLFLSIFLMSIYELLPSGPGYLFHYSLGCYLVCLVFLVLVYRAHSGRFSLIKIEGRNLYLPRWTNPEKHKIIPLRNIYSIQLRAKDKDGFIMIGLKKGLNRMLITSQFEVTEDISKLINIIRDAIAYYEEGTAKLDVREKIGKSYENIVPACSITISSLLIIFYILQQTLIEDSNFVFELLRLGGLNKYLLITGENFRITSSLFLHLNSFHLLVNLFTLMIFGNLIEHIIRKINLMTVFLLSGVFSSFFSILSGQYVVTIGASGGIYGVIGAYLFIRIKYSDVLPSFIQLQQGWVLFLIFSINMLYSLFDSNIDFYCHLGGLAAGFVYMTIISYHQNHKISILGGRNKITNCLFLILTLFYIYNFISLNNFIITYQNPEDYQNHLIQSVLDEDAARPSDQVINFISYFIAKQEDTAAGVLHKAKTKMELIVEKRPQNHQCKDTLALIYFRLGFLDKAIKLQKQAVTLKDLKEYRTRLKRFEEYKSGNN